MKNFKIIMLSLLFCPCSYQIIYPEDYKDLLDATYNLLLDQNNKHENNVIIQSDNQNSSEEEQLTTEENKITASSLYQQEEQSQSQPVQEEIKTQLIPASMNQNTSAVAEESVEPAMQTMTVSDQPEAKMFKTAIEPATSQEVSMQNRSIDPALTLTSLEDSATAQASTQLEDDDEDEDDNNQDEDDTTDTAQPSTQLEDEDEDDTTEPIASQEPITPSTESRANNIEETKKIITPVLEENNLQTLAGQQDLIKEESSLEKSFSTPELVKTDQEKVSDEAPVMLESSEQNAKETVTDTINTIPAEQVISKSDTEKMNVPLTKQTVTQNEQIVQPEQPQLVKVYPVFDAARLGIQKVKSAAQSMFDYVYEFFTKKPEVKIQWLEELQ